MNLSMQMKASQAKSKGFMDRIRIIQTAAMSFILRSMKEQDLRLSRPVIAAIDRG
jgi:hypothetical protein